MEADADLRRKIAEWKASYETPSADSSEEAARLEFVKSIQNLAHSNVKRVLGSIKPETLGPIARYPFWNDAGKFGVLGAQSMAKFLNTIDPSDNSVNVLINKDVLMSRLMSCLGEETQALTAHFLMYRTKLTPIAPDLNHRAAASMSDHIKLTLDKHASNGNVYQLGIAAQKEIEEILRLSQKAAKAHKSAGNSGSATELFSVKDKKEKVDKAVADKLGGLGRSVDTTPSSSPNLFSGK